MIDAKSTQQNDRGKGREMKWKQSMRTKPVPIPSPPLVFVAAFAMAVVLAAVVYLLGRGSSDQVIAVVITFLGVMITAAAKSHADIKSEQRLRLDAAMQAGQLLTPTVGVAVSPAAAASGLLALTDLGRSKLAVAMLLDLWANDEVSSEVAILAIDKALMSGDDTTAQIAAEVLCQNSHKLDPTKPAHWPTVLDTYWVPQATEKTKILLIESLVEMSARSRREEPSINALRAFAIRIVFIHRREPRGRHHHFRRCIAGFAEALIPAFESGDLNFYDGSSHISRHTLVAVAHEFKENPDSFFADVTRARRRELAEWALRCNEAGVITSIGALAAPTCSDSMDEASHPDEVATATTSS